MEVFNYWLPFYSWGYWGQLHGNREASPSQLCRHEQPNAVASTVCGNRFTIVCFWVQNLIIHTRNFSSTEVKSPLESNFYCNKNYNLCVLGCILLQHSLQWIHNWNKATAYDFLAAIPNTNYFLHKIITVIINTAHAFVLLYCPVFNLTSSLSCTLTLAPWVQR